ncbi:ECF transporter S component [Anaeromicropila herbilytica]|uniref:Membrane protein n=1 Tax=Anaeromicropila herbilytica TaxID=2785025 RepID=A0A7R7EJ63_9FIRM|nr:ECF transporter S component [Anaeromicropila herbilytica]BCN29801.1 membrane protein [Anaeromicropila herbilytica]
MKLNKTQLMVITSLMAALTCIATMVFHVPSPLKGYIHLGDGFVLLSGIILGPLYGGAAAGIGSMLADLLLGYAEYAPATFIIKALAAILAALIYHILLTKIKNKRIYFVPIIFAGIIANIIVTLGYFLFESTVLGYGIASASNIPANILQGVFAIITCVILLPVLSASPIIRQYMVHKA